MKLISNKHTLPDIHYGDELAHSVNFNTFSSDTKKQIVLKFSKSDIAVISKTQAFFGNMAGDSIKTDLLEQRIRHTVGFKRGRIDIILNYEASK